MRSCEKGSDDGDGSALDAASTESRLSAAGAVKAEIEAVEVETTDRSGLDDRRVRSIDAAQ